MKLPNPSPDLEQMLRDYQRVSRIWHNQGGGESVSVTEAINLLTECIRQQQSPLLAQRAEELAQNIIFGNQRRRTTGRKVS